MPASETTPSPYFHDLIRAGTLFPTEEDDAALFDDCGRRFADTFCEDAQHLLARARSTPGVEQIGALGGDQTTAVVVDVVNTLEETYVAFSVVRINTSRLVMILGAFDVEAAFTDWELVERSPATLLRVADGEICYGIVRS